MISLSLQVKRICRATFIVSCGLFVACSENVNSDYCQNHYLFHPGHHDQTGLLAVTVGDDGSLLSETRLPLLLFESEQSVAVTMERLRDVNNAFTLTSDRECDAGTSAVTIEDQMIVAKHSSNCGNGSKLDQMNVVLFDRIAELDEVEVIVVTPATSKRFAISRQCDAAIYRLDKK